MVPYGTMAAFTMIFGASPRVRTIESLLALSAAPFTIPELAEIAGLHKPSAYRIARQLEKEGFIVPEAASEGEFRVASDSPQIKILSHLESALELAETAGEDAESAFSAAVLGDLLQTVAPSLSEAEFFDRTVPALPRIAEARLEFKGVRNSNLEPAYMETTGREGAIVVGE